MDNGRDPAADDGTRAPIVAAAAQLTPTQTAWARFVHHVTVACERCRDIDQTSCDDAEQLHRAWRRLTDEAFGRLAEG